MDDTGSAVAEENPEHCVIARYRLADSAFGQPSQRATVYEAQRLLIEAIDRAGAGEFDGNEFGGGEVMLYAYGPDADALFAAMVPVLRNLPWRPAHAMLRYGAASDPLAVERRVDL